MLYSIETKSLSKSFGDLKAVDDISFNVENGEIFGFYYPPEIKNWGCDDWIGDIYEVHNLKHSIPQRIIYFGGKPRYNVDKTYRTQIADCMIRYMNNIQMFISRKDFEYPFAENSQPKG